MYNLKKPVEAYQCGVHPMSHIPEYFPKDSMLLVSNELPNLWCVKIGTQFIWCSDEEFLSTFEYMQEGDAYTAYQESKLAEYKTYTDGNGY